MNIFSELTTKSEGEVGDPWGGTTPLYMKWPEENQTWSYEKSTQTENYDDHHYTPRPKFGFIKKTRVCQFFENYNNHHSIYFCFLNNCRDYLPSRLSKTEIISTINSNTTTCSTIGCNWSKLRLKENKNKFRNGSFIINFYINISWFRINWVLDKADMVYYPQFSTVQGSIASPAWESLLV